MPTCETLECCSGDNPLTYEVTPTSGVYLRTASDPADGGTTTGDGDYAIGDSVTVTATPGIPTSLDVGVDMVFVVDESGSMGSVRSLLNVLLPDLDATLQAKGIGANTVPNQYGIVGFSAAAGGVHGIADGVAHEHSPLDTFANFMADISGLVGTSGGLGEDAYDGIAFAMDQMAWRDVVGVARVIVFITDEDRNYHYYTTGGATQLDQYAALAAQLNTFDGLLLAVHSTVLKDADQNFVLGYGYDRVTYNADGAGGYTNNTGGYAFSAGGGGDSGTYGSGMVEEYHDLAMDALVQGQVWAFEQFRQKVGVCDTNGTTVHSTAIVDTAGRFTGYAPGTVITIAGVDYIIASVTDFEYLELTTDAGIQTGADWTVPDPNRDSFMAALTDKMDDSITQILLWTFVGWYNSGGELVSTDASFTFTILNNTVLTARFIHE